MLMCCLLLLYTIHSLSRSHKSNFPWAVPLTAPESHQTVIFISDIWSATFSITLKTNMESLKWLLKGIFSSRDSRASILRLEFYVGFGDVPIQYQVTTTLFGPPTLILPVNSKTCLLTCPLKTQKKTLKKQSKAECGYVGFCWCVSSKVHAMFVWEPLLLAFATVQRPQTHRTSKDAKGCRRGTDQLKHRWSWCMLCC